MLRVQCLGYGAWGTVLGVRCLGRPDAVLGTVTAAGTGTVIGTVPDILTVAGAGAMVR